MEWHIFFIYYGILLHKSEAVFNSSNKEQQKAIKLPPCASCRVLTDSFKQGMDRTSRGKFEGGDTAWEEEKMKSYKNSEVRLVEIQEKLCSEVERGQTQCHTENEKHESLIEEWWFNHQETHPTLYDWLCIEQLSVCCPSNHYGSKCLPCKGGVDNPCSGNGRCKGGGTRKGNGECDCNPGYEGELCNQCALGFYEAYKDETKILCDSCHKACLGHCTQAGPKSCIACKSGWLMDTDVGCIDVNECLASFPPCSQNEFCLNNEGSHSCIKCDKACNGCSGDGPDMCDTCAEGFILEKEVCIENARNGIETVTDDQPVETESKSDTQQEETNSLTDFQPKKNELLNDSQSDETKSNVVQPEQTKSFTDVLPEGTKSLTDSQPEETKSEL